MQLSFFNQQVEPMPELDLSRVKAQLVDHKTIRPILINDHYLHRDCQTILRVGMYIDGILSGVCCYGSTIASVSDAICGKQYRYNVLDLNRLYVYDYAGKNSESWLIGQSFKFLRKYYPDRFILISYASAADGHIGTVYQATNWLYTGKSSTGLEFYLDGKVLTARAIMAHYGTISKPQLKDMFGDRIDWSKTTPKYRYIQFLGSKSQKKTLQKLLKWKVLQYPKKS